MIALQGSKEIPKNIVNKLIIPMKKYEGNNKSTDNFTEIIMQDKRKVLIEDSNKKKIMSETTVIKFIDTRG